MQLKQQATFRERSTMDRASKWAKLTSVTSILTSILWKNLSSGVTREFKALTNTTKMNNGEGEGEGILGLQSLLLFCLGEQGCYLPSINAASSIFKPLRLPCYFLFFRNHLFPAWRKIFWFLALPYSVTAYINSLNVRVRREYFFFPPHIYYQKYHPLSALTSWKTKSHALLMFLSQQILCLPYWTYPLSLHLLHFSWVWATEVVFSISSVINV